MTIFKSKLNIFLGLAILAVVGLFLFFAPRQGNRLNACDDAPLCPPQGTITFTVGARIEGQCLFTGSVGWNTTINVSNARVTVNDGEGEKVFAEGVKGSQETPWLKPNQTYTFTLTNLDNNTFLGSASGTAPDLNCNPPVPSGNITFTVGSRITGECLFTGNVSWGTQNVSNARVTVGSQTLGEGKQGSSETPWLQPNQSYTFILTNLDNNTTLGSSSAAAPALDCNPAPPPSGNITFTVGARITGECLFTGNVSWSTQNVGNARVTIGEKTLGEGKQGSVATPWLQPGQSYTFTLTNLDNNTTLGSASGTAPDLNCNPPLPPSGNITFTVGGRISGECLFTGTVSWSTTNVGNARVTVGDKTLGEGKQGSTETPWLVPGQSYTFTLTNLDNNTFLGSASGTAPSLDCNPVKAPRGEINFLVLGRIPGECLFTGNVLWTTQNVGNARVTIGEKTLGEGKEGSVATPWLVPGQLYTFILTNLDNNTVLGSSSAAAPSLDCNPVKVPPTGTISFTLGARISGQCLFTGTVSWTTQNINAGSVRVSVGSKVMAEGVASGSVETPWLQPGQHYVFTLSNIDTNTTLATTTADIPSLNCAPTPPSGSISFKLGARISGQCLFTGTVSWTTQNINAGSVRVSVGSKVMAEGVASGSVETPWLQPGEHYVFTLSNIDNNTTLATTTADVPSLDCNPVKLPPSGQLTFTLGGKANVTGFCGYTGTLSWTTQNVANAKVTVQNITDGESEKIIAVGQTSGSVETPWLKPNGQYVFKLYNLDVTPNTLLDSKTANIPSLTCGTTSASLNITKEVRNVTQNGSFASSINATQNDVAQYRITVKNIGSAAANNVVITDSFNLTGVNISDLVVSKSYTGTFIDGIRVAKLDPNDSIVITFSLTVAIQNGSITNTATAVADNAGSVSAQAQINVNTTVGQPLLSITKEVRNVTQNGSFASSASATKNDKVQYRITVKNTGTAVANQIYITDVFSISPISTSELSVSKTFTGNLDDGIRVTQLAANDTIVITFSAIVPIENGTIRNTATANAGNGNSISAQAQVNVSTVTGQANLAITKEVRNATQNGAFATNITANKNDSVQYRITVRNNGSIAANNVIITDFFTSGGNPATTGLSVSKGYSGNLSDGIIISKLDPNDSVVVTFNITVGIDNGTINNTATATSANTNSVNASASVSVSTVSQNGILQLTKEIRNVTQGSAFSNSATAQKNEIVEYRITVKAGNAVTLNNVKITDTFNSASNILRFVDGSLTVGGQTQGSGVLSSGIVISSLTQTPVVILYRGTAVADQGSFTNIALATADNANSVTASAQLNILFVPAGQPALSITKEVKNVTKGGSFSGSIIADKNDVVQYRITVKNVGSATANSVFVSDSNPLQGSGLSVSKTYTGNLSAGIGLGTLAAGETVTITYQATVNIDSGTIMNLAAVSASNAPTQNATAIINVNNNNNGGGNIYQNCVNNSCNINNTTTTTTTTTNNYYYYTYNNGVVTANLNYSLGIVKRVRLQSGGTFQKSVTANNGSTVEFEIVVTNNGGQAVNNVIVSDTLNSGLSLLGNVNVDGGYNGNYYGGNSISSINLGSLSQGQQRRITFQAQVNSFGNGQSSVQNIAQARGDSVSQVQDDAWVFLNTGSVQGANVNLVFSKRAVNETKNADATSVLAGREDFITYTLTATNNGSAPANNFAITDDLSQVLPFGDITDNGGGTLSGNVINFPQITIPANGSVSRSFKVRVKFSLSENVRYTMVNTYGNTVSININTPRVLGAFTAPKTGADTAGLTFGGLLTSGFALIRHRKHLLKLIFT